MDIDDDVFKKTAANGSYTQQYEFAYKSSSVIEDAEIRSEEDNIFFCWNIKREGLDVFIIIVEDEQRLS